MATSVRTSATNTNTTLAQCLRARFLDTYWTPC
jgi:hypothetical protein